MYLEFWTDQPRPSFLLHNEYRRQNIASTVPCGWYMQTPAVPICTPWTIYGRGNTESRYSRGEKKEQLDPGMKRPVTCLLDTKYNGEKENHRFRIGNPWPNQALGTHLALKAGLAKVRRSFFEKQFLARLCDWTTRRLRWKSLVFDN